MMKGMYSAKLIFLLLFQNLFLNLILNESTRFRIEQNPASNL